MAPAGSGSARLARLPDNELVALAQGGDRAALDALLRRHHDRVFAVCRRLCGDPADAADATQEALVAIVRGLSRFDGRATFTTWLYRVATNAALDELRRRRRRPIPTLDAPAHPGTAADDGATWLEALADRGQSFDDMIGDRDEVDAALQRLPADYRAAVVLRDLCTLDYDEIAQVLDIPPGTVRSRIARGRAALARLLPDPGNQPASSTRQSAGTPSDDRPSTGPRELR